MPDSSGRLISRLMAENKEMIAYRPKLNRITGSVLASVLLQQANYRFVNTGEQPFYKFRAPCMLFTGKVTAGLTNWAFPAMNLIRR
jgi:hypothetical protein